MTPVWRDLPGWDLSGWRVFYVVMLVSLLTVLVTGGLEPFAGGLVVLAVGVGVAAVTSGHGSSRVSGKSAIVLQLPNTALFPHEMRILSDGAVPMQWPKLLRDAEKRKRPVVVVASVDSWVADYGVLATVVETSGDFWLEGVSRVEVTRRRAVCPSVVQCTYVTLVDEAGQHAPTTVSSVKDAFERWARDHNVDDSVLDEVRHDGDPGTVSDLVEASLTKLDPRRAEKLLSTGDVAERLRLCASLMAESLGEGAASDRQVSTAFGDFVAEAPDTLETFEDVGGMLPLKTQIADTIGFIAENPDVATRMRIAVNGVLLYGAPGTGKTMIARATAGEYRLRLLTVSSGDLGADGLMGVAERKVEAAFRTAARNAPCLLFFDEFDSIGGRRDSKAGSEQFQRQIVGALLRGLDQLKDAPNVIVMAATNDIESLDPALIRSGRFDARVRVERPDAEARAAIFGVRLRGLSMERSVDLTDLVSETEGRSAADIVAIVDSAKLAAARRAVESGHSDSSPIRQADLAEALEARRGKD
jgi:AAA+ superfamily predicted ATPase